MLFITFDMMNDRYAIAAADIVEIVPLVNTKKIPDTPDYVRGIINFRGQPIPVVDINQYSGHGECRHSLSTRILLVRYVRLGNIRIIGLIAEHVTETVKCSYDEFTESGVNSETSAFQTKVARIDGKFIQLIDISKIFPEELDMRLFAA